MESIFWVVKKDGSAACFPSLVRNLTLTGGDFVFVRRCKDLPHSQSDCLLTVESEKACGAAAPRMGSSSNRPMAARMEVRVIVVRSWEFRGRASRGLEGVQGGELRGLIVSAVFIDCGKALSVARRASCFTQSV